jgi:23S rRNA pseudouridine1911/1915/1917 synthase
MMQYILQNDLPLIEALKLYYPESSKRTYLSWIKWGRVTIDGLPQNRANSLVKAGQILALEKKEPTQTASGIPILYQDRWMIVIDKPAGLLSVPAEKDTLNALHLLKIGFKSASLLPVHRLDQETSGVLLFARSKMAEVQLNHLFEKHDLEREYVAIVDGHIPCKSGTWESYLREKENYDVEITTADLGKKGVTHYEVVRRSKKFSFLRLRLETGRKHQIRVQAAHAGHPVVGDKRYGSLSNPYKRLCLHASALSFIHPFTHKKMTFTSTPKHTHRGFAMHFPFPDAPLPC